ncbi:MAG TPA: PD-(D/E)XK nuclease family protein, partial [Polyangia bacterium]
MGIDLFIVRAGVTPAERFGYVLRVPPVPDPAELAAAGVDVARDVAALEDRLFAHLLAGMGTPARLVPHGLVEPTPWERRFVGWVARKLGVPPVAGWDHLAEAARNPAFAALAAAVADPLAAAPPPSPAVGLLEGDDFELEALGAVRHLRDWLGARPLAAWPAACDDALVLLPAAGGRREIWKRTLERHGLPADAPVYATLRDTPLGQWLLALARLGDWHELEATVGRDDLRAALLAPFTSLPEGARRADLRACLRSLRAHAVSLDAWRGHVKRYFAEERAAIADLDLEDDERAERLQELAARAKGLDRFVRLIVDAFGGAKSGFFAALRDVMKALGTSPRIRASAEPGAIRALERAHDLLRRLAEEEAGAGRGGLPDPRVALECGLADAVIRTDTPPQHGVRIATYHQYDGRGAGFVVLAGLEEGGYPIAPRRQSRATALVAQALGLAAPTAELQRQARLAAAAAGQARERVLLSWSRCDEAGADTFPGPLVAAIRARDGRPGLTEERVTGRDAVPVRLQDLRSPADIVAQPDRRVAPLLPAGPTRERWEHAAAMAVHAQNVDAARAPAADAPFGPYTGFVGVPLVADRYSPTTLEVLGQCPARYFLERVIGVQEAADQDVDLDALELGSLLHDALSRCALQAIKKKDAWDLSAAGGDVDTHVARVSERLDRAIDEAAAAFKTANPTMCGALVDEVTARWKNALRQWLASEAGQPTGGVYAPGGPPAVADLDDAQLTAIGGRSQKAAAAVAAYRGADLDEALA